MPKQKITFIENIESENSGGGMISDTITLTNNYMIHIGSDGISIHKKPNEYQQEDIFGDYVAGIEFE